MSVREQVRDYTRRVRRRLRLETGMRGLALCGGAALLLTVILVLLANAWRFSEGAVRAATVALWGGLAVTLALFLARVSRESKIAKPIRMLAKMSSDKRSGLFRKRIDIKSAAKDAASATIIESTT